MDFFTPHDFVQLGGMGIMLLIAVVVLREQMKALADAFTKHEKLDDQRFEKVDEDVRELRRDMR